MCLSSWVVEWHLYLLLEYINWEEVLYVLAKRAPEAAGCPNSGLPPPKALPVLGAVAPKASVRDVPAAKVPPFALPLPPNAEVPPPNELDPKAGLGVAKEKVLAVEEVAVF
jgi:hypothetical protein